MYVRLVSSQQAACEAHGSSPRSASSQRRRPSATCALGVGLSRRWRAHTSTTGSPRLACGFGSWFDRQQREEARHDAVPVANDGERAGLRIPPRRDQVSGLRRLVAACDRCDRRGVLGSGRLDRKRLGAAREERLPDGGVLDEVQHVGRVPPQLRGRRLADLLPQLAPRCSAVVPVADRIRAAEEAARSRLAPPHGRRGRPGRPRRTVAGAGDRWRRLRRRPTSIAPSRGSVTRLTTDAASRERRATGSVTSQR